MSSKPSDAASESTPSENPAPGSGPRGRQRRRGDRQGQGQGAGPRPQVAAHFDWNSFEADHASVVSEGFEQRHGDLQFRARLTDGRQAFVRLLFEHQSPHVECGTRIK